MEGDAAPARFQCPDGCSCTEFTGCSEAVEVSAATERVWSVGDRCRYCHFGEWRNGTIEALLYGGNVVRVRIANGGGSYVMVWNLHKAVDE